MQRQLDQSLLQPVLTRGARVRYLLITAVWIGTVLWFWQWWLRPEHVANLPGFALSTVVLGWIYFLQLYFVVIFHKAKRSAAPDPVPGQHRVAMIATKTPSEPFSVLQTTLRAMLAQDYPHDTWLADEDPSEETRQWCAAHGVLISSRKGVADYHRAVWPRRTRCKEGNLAYFYDHWGYDGYDIVAQMDADHVPQPGYLRAALRPFADPAVGYVSAPSICSANAAKSWAARARMESEAAFHGVFQAGYTGALAPMCIGSHYVVRTAALRDVGGLGPELAEDHSTSMILNAGGWRGIHAMDAIAYGDGPDTLADMITQEFQWSRSLMSLLLTHTPRYLGRLPWRLRFQFVFCQALYPLIALTAALIYALPIAALVFDMRFADVTYPAFLAHSLPTLVTILLFAMLLKRDGFFRPKDARVISWEKALFLLVQWPWVAWGCMMAVRDRLTGGFVDFRITPKGRAAAAPLPYRIIAVYAVLMLGCTVPVLVLPATEAAGFYLLSAFNGLLYAAIVAVAVVWQLRETESLQRFGPGMRLQFGTVGMVCGVLVLTLFLRAADGVHALTSGAPFSVTRAEFVASGAGRGSDLGTMQTRFSRPVWFFPIAFKDLFKKELQNADQ
jgi:cellulose synthase (UDP-forming)